MVFIKMFVNNFPEEFYGEFRDFAMRILQHEKWNLEYFMIFIFIFFSRKTFRYDQDFGNVGY
jgi:hypothetical protein